MKKQLIYTYILIIGIIVGCTSTKSENEITLKRMAKLESDVYDASLTQFDIGQGYYEEVNWNIESTRRNDDSRIKLQKVEYLLSKMDSIENYSNILVALVDEIKYELLVQSNEDLKKVKQGDDNSILWGKLESRKSAQPVKFNLSAINNKGRTISNKVMLDSDGALTEKSLNLWNTLLLFRKKIIEHTGSYNWGKQKFKIEISNVDKFSSAKDLRSKVELMIDGSKANIIDDRQVLIDLYMMLTLESSKDGGNHWIKSTFENTSIIEALSALTSFQYDVLSARRLALAHWKSKIGHCCYRFDEILPVATGPSTVIQGNPINITVIVAAYDSYNSPKVTIDGSGVIHYEEGLGIITISPESTGLQTYRGTVGLKTMSGLEKTYNWEWSVNVLEK